MLKHISMLECTLSDFFAVRNLSAIAIAFEDFNFAIAAPVGVKEIIFGDGGALRMMF